MSDAIAPTPPARAVSLHATDARTRRRNAAEKRFKAYGLTAIGIGLAFLAALLFAIVSNGSAAFTQTFVEVPITLDAEEIAAAESSIVKTSKYREIIHGALLEQLADAGIETDMDAAELGKILSSSEAAEMRDFALANPERMGETVRFDFLASSRVDGYLKGRVTRDALARDQNLDAAHLDLVDRLAEQGIVVKRFNWDFILGADASDQRPEQAGIGVAMLGSFFMMLVVLALALPIGVAASIYLEEFAPKNRITDFIEVNISNLAAVPSIVFGILGLAVFIQFAGLPQSAPLVGGLVLTLMTLPTIIISTRAALAAVPPSIRAAALGVGASKMQSVFHHVLPLAMPGILTGTIIGLAQALGETAPLLLIGMVGFIASNYPDGVVSGFTDPNSAMPAQIYEWAKRADPAFYERAWGGIIILLLFLMTMNFIAILLRRRFERRW
ncbi:phosphate ABC transporter, permease protein [Oceanicola granulosus HTCC2516]|uniref:Phosphate transport system permease protein PstA n=1 Tax=Oceanicola granulosus (strain ATCC BAA-861 / DSM 15982 / KCTC 12143 / HTCC2516) TaxID=314256 RepID=Q2CE56_OCEGH|nr:phosphate ABC transporter permease PstA [Oceanicola granulosus]EAR51004.1 phosphate ABC transporter, permease protein [Oceanicola granulosus HTCC2516]